MPMLTPSQVHLDVPLTNLTLAWLQDTTNFIADKVFPSVSVGKQSDKYYIYNRGEFNRSGHRKPLAPRTRPERIGMSVSNSSYFAEVYGLATDFDQQTLANEDAALETRTAGAAMLMTNMLIDREKDFATKFFSTGIWTTEKSGNATASGTPMSFIYKGLSQCSTTNARLGAIWLQSRHFNLRRSGILSERQHITCLGNLATMVQ